MLQKLVYISGALDHMAGAGVWCRALYDPQPGQFVGIMTLGMFLMMAAAA